MTNQSDYDWDALKDSIRGYLSTAVPTMVQDIDDMVQEIFLLLITKQEPVLNAEAFCIGCAKLKVCELLRKKDRDSMAANIDNFVHLRDKTLSPLEHAILKDKYYFAVNFLNKEKKDRNKSILRRMLFVEKDKHTDIVSDKVAKDFGLTPAGVDTIVFRFRQKLKAAYEHF